MKKEQANGRDVKALMDMLANTDGRLRGKARESLVTLGKPAVPFLVEAMRASEPIQVSPGTSKPATRGHLKTSHWFGKLIASVG